MKINETIHHYPRSTAYLLVMVTLVFLLQVWEVFG